SPWPIWTCCARRSPPSRSCYSKSSAAGEAILPRAPQQTVSLSLFPLHLNPLRSLGSGVENTPYSQGRKGMGKLSAPALATLSILTVACCGARGDVIVYRQGQFPDAGYQHLGSNIYQGSPNANLGAEALMRVGNAKALGNVVSFPIRGVLAFPLTGIPAG